MTDARGKIPVYWDLDPNWVNEYKAEIRAIKSLAKGTASKEEQAKAMNYILAVLCNRAGNQFYATDRETTFALGRKFVGDQIAAAINVPITGKED